MCGSGWVGVWGVGWVAVWRGWVGVFCVGCKHVGWVGEECMVCWLGGCVGWCDSLKMILKQFQFAVFKLFSGFDV